MASNACPNCGRFDLGNYCSACGGEMRPQSTLDSLVSNYVPLNRAYWSRVPLSLWRAAFSPGRYTVDWESGSRQKYLAPLALLLLVGTIGGIAEFFGRPYPTKPVVDSIDTMATMLPFADTLFAAWLEDAKRDPDLFSERMLFFGSSWPAACVGSIILAATATKVLGQPRSFGFDATAGVVASIGLACLFIAGYVVSLFEPSFRESSWNGIIVLPSYVYCVVHLKVAYGVPYALGMIRALIMGIFALFFLWLSAMLCFVLAAASV